MMGTDKFVKEAENYNNILKTPKEHPGSQVL